MDLFLAGLSHKTAPIEVRERLAFSGDALELALSRLRRLPGISETIIVSTCNRTEIYGIAADGDSGTAEVADWMAERSATDLAPHLYLKTGAQALTHLFRVASSLDSMVVGEPQILGQVKTGFQAARESRNAGPRIERIFSRAFQVAKKIRNETTIGENAVSMSFVAVELARKIFGELKDKRILIMGAGEMSELAATHLRTNGAGSVVVANRSLDKAEALAARFAGEARPLSQVGALLEEVDIVLSSTAAPGFLITRDQMAKVIRARRYRPIFLIDLAVPRDVDPAVNDLDNVYAYDVDDMEKVVDDNLRQRAQEAEKGDRIVRREVAEYLAEEQARAVMPVVAALRHTASEIAEAEAARTLANLAGAGLTDKQVQSVEAMAQAIVNKLLHEPTTVLRGTAATHDGERLAAAVVSLFALDVDAVTAAIASEKARRRAARLARLEREGGGGAAAGDDDEDDHGGVVNNVVPIDRAGGKGQG